MDKKIYAMKDTKMRKFVTVFLENDHVNAVRGLEYILMNQEKSQISTYPGDFEMYWLGDINQDTGKIICPESPEFIISANQCIMEIRRRLDRQKSVESASVADLGSLTGELEKAIHNSEKQRTSEGSRDGALAPQS